MKSIILKCFLKYIILLKTENYCSNSHKEYYHEECINLFYKLLKNKTFF